MSRPCEADHDLTPDTCRLCWLYLNDHAYYAAWTGNRNGWPANLKANWSSPIGPSPTRITPIDLARLAPAYDHTKFNASLARHKGRLLLAYRCGQGGSQIHISEMSEDLTPGRSVLVPLNHAWAQSSREDPRLFTHGDQLCVSYCGVLGNPGNGQPGSTHQLVARLRDDLSVERIDFPHYPAGNPKWEKNWAMFDHGGQLHAVYTVQPHVVLRIGTDTSWPAEHQNKAMTWTGGDMRGGAPPVLVEGEYWHWFHGKTGTGHPTPSGPSRTTVYTMGVYAFEGGPPFRPTRFIPAPLVWGDEATRGPCWCAVVFPCGAIYEGGRWMVSAGIHDRSISVFEFDHEAIVKAAVKL